MSEKVGISKDGKKLVLDINDAKNILSMLYEVIDKKEIIRDGVDERITSYERMYDYFDAAGYEDIEDMISNIK